MFFFSFVLKFDTHSVTKILGRAHSRCAVRIKSCMLGKLGDSTALGKYCLSLLSESGLVKEEDQLL